MHAIDLNCDMGEGLTNDALLMPYISSANIACGYHAGDESIMKHTVDLALLNGVAIGAHPGFNDKANFGRTEMHLSLEEVHELITVQLYVLQKITENLGAKLHHVKPHGALYNQAAKDKLLALAIASAVKDIDKNLILFGLSGSFLISEAIEIGMILAVFLFMRNMIKISDVSMLAKELDDDGSETRGERGTRVVGHARHSCSRYAEHNCAESHAVHRACPAEQPPGGHAMSGLRPIAYPR